MHWFINDWAIDDQIYKIPSWLCFNYTKIKKLTPVKLNFEEIAFRSDVDVESSRYAKANLKYPMMVSIMKNPLNKKYRLIDGRHRLYKLIENGSKEGYFYIIPEEFIMQNLIKVNPTTLTSYK